jgi:Fe-S oxidoreductase
MQRHPPRSEGQPVVLWSDTFTNYFHPQVGRAAVAVLESLGYHVIVPEQACCGRPLYDFGLLESAREHLDALYVAVVSAAGPEVPIVVLEPSCFAVFRDESRNLSGDRPIARALAERAVLFDSFIAAHHDEGTLPVVAGEALVHVHCHQQAMVGREPTARALAAAKLDGRILDAGCCGMAGAFGYDKAHYRVSCDVGERVLLPAVRALPQETTVIANGFSCREQIQQLTGRRACHFAEVLGRNLERPE